MTRGGEALRSMTETVSDGGFFTTVVTPFTFSTLLSLPETAICAPATEARLAIAGRAHAQGVLDFVTFDGVDYIRWTEEPGRTLVRSDLGIEFATVECSIGEDRRGCPFGVDAAAAFMPAGTKMYAVRGYRTDFRLAAVWKDRIFLYQAWRNARAKVGGDLYDIAGKVRRIDVQRGEPTPAAPGIPVTITSLRDAEALVDVIVRGALP